MAMSDQSSSIPNTALVTIELDESDIPGAALSTPLESRTILSISSRKMPTANLGVRLHLSLLQLKHTVRRAGGTYMFSTTYIGYRLSHQLYQSGPILAQS